MASHDRDRAVALSLQLAQAHQELRRQMDQVRSGLGRQRPAGNKLAVHCLAFCAALTSHHHGEDTGMFADLLRERPDLAGIVAKLVEDHEMVASILSRVAELVGKATALSGSAMDEVGRELDGLAAIMESHFNFEERAISEALDSGIAASSWSDMVFTFHDNAH
jgi:hypothetical protein